MKYLRAEQHYIDFYDLLTIKECLRVIDTFRDVYQKHKNDKDIKNLSQEDKIKGLSYILNRDLLFRKTENFRKKKETIQEWTERDQELQNYYDNTSAPQKIYCPDCKSQMYTKSKMLRDWDDKPLRMLFFFDCPSCKKRIGIYDDGEEHISKPSLCPKCKKKVKQSHTRKGNIVTWKTKCSQCGYSKTEIDDWDKEDAERVKEEKEDKDLLKKYRSEFCFSEKEGQEHIELFEKMKIASQVYDETKQEYDNQSYQKSLQLKKLEISQLEKLVNNILKEEKYSEISFDKPDLGRYVTLSFTFQNLDSRKKERTDLKELEKKIKEELESTNWRLTGELMYQLGFISGTLKGYEGKDDLWKLAGKQEKKVNEELKLKYAGDSIIELARMSGKYEGIENQRKARLKDEPDGFFLEASEGPYSCGICGDNHYGDKIWWTLDGLRCADCHRNIIKNKIKISGHKYDDSSNWFADWQIQSHHGVHPATRGKLKRQGLLVGRDFKNQQGQIYFTIYLKNENKDFLEKYPKKEGKKVEIKMVDSEGKD